ncbi:MAG: hypothetical protein J6I73_02710 [Treponema sp.]|nr:hypothetical protein [Treponema sp.]
MKKIATGILIVAVSISSLFAIDIGGKINSTTKYQGVDFGSLKWYESAGIHVWLTQQFTEELKLATDVSYEFRWDQADGTKRNILNLNVLKFTGLFKIKTASTFEVSVGRFAVSDVTGAIFNQTNDGVFLKWTLPRGAVNIYGGITRLLNSHDTVILRQDSNTVVPISHAHVLYVLGPKYIPFGATMTITPMFLNQNFAMEGWGFFDFSGNEYHRLYGTLALSGPLARNLFYTASTTFSKTTADDFSNLSKINVSYYPVQVAALNFNFVYASGNNGALAPFRGFSSQSAVLATNSMDFSTEYDSKLIFGLSGSYTIASRVYLGAEIAAVFACPDKTSYHGFQWQFNAVWNIFHDLQISAGMYQYIANAKENGKTCFLLTGTFVF